LTLITTLANVDRFTKIYSLSDSWGKFIHLNHKGSPPHYSPEGLRAKARVITFCTSVGYIESQHTEDKSPLKGRGQDHVTYSKYLGTQWYLSSG